MPPALEASSPLRRSGTWWLRRPLLIAAAALTVVAIATAHSLPAAAGSLELRPRAASAATDRAEVQRFSVPADVELAEPTREAEVTVVAAPRQDRWIAPSAGALRDGYGPRPDAPAAGAGDFHHGQDIAVPCGADVRAAAPGRVVEAGWHGTYGNWVLLDHGHGVRTGYAHASRLLVAVGDRVSTGDVIASAGSTGASSGCHLHYETLRRGDAVDPVRFMLERGVRLGG